MKKILVTGSAGYVGSVLVGKLLEAGHYVVGMDNLMYSQQSMLQYIPYPNFKFVWGDVDSSYEEYVELVPQFDYLLPLASIVGGPASSRDKRKSGPVDWSTVKLLNDLPDLKTKIIYPTTNSGYGCKSGEVYCTEETLLEPISVYGEQKVYVENFLLKNYENVITLRLATVFGVSPRMRLDLLVNFFVWKAVTEGVLTVAQPHAKRNYVHINDVCDCFIYCINNFNVMRGNAFNLGLNTNHSKMELAEIVKSFTECEILETKSYVDPDRRNYVVSNQKINDAGFTPNVQVEDAVPNIMEACKMLQFLNYGRTSFRNA